VLSDIFFGAGARFDLHRVLVLAVGFGSYRATKRLRAVSNRSSDATPLDQLFAELSGRSDHAWRDDALLDRRRFDRGFDAIFEAPHATDEHEQLSPKLGEFFDNLIGRPGHAITVSGAAP
jgi:hypothetical protein